MDGSGVSVMDEEGGVSDNRYLLNDFEWPAVNFPTAPHAKSSKSGQGFRLSHAAIATASSSLERVEGVSPLSP